MAETCSHQDESRKNVSATAHVVAYIRSMESTLHKEDYWFHDPYAEALAGDIGPNGIAQTELTVWQTLTPEKKQRFVDALATRTRVIDEFMLESFSAENSVSGGSGVSGGPVEQIVALGAGLCTRPWRITPPVSTESKISYFEVDFPEIFNYKLGVLKSMNAETLFNYHNVTADLSLPTWPEVLESAGLDRSKRTLWLMEGFCNYLKEEELVPLLKTVAAMSVPGSRLIATFVSLTMAKTRSFELHRFWHDNPLEFFMQFGWNGRQDDVEDLAAAFGRKTSEGNERRGYYIVRLTK